MKFIKTIPSEVTSWGPSQQEPQDTVISLQPFPVQQAFRLRGPFSSCKRTARSEGNLLYAIILLGIEMVTENLCPYLYRKTFLLILSLSPHLKLPCKYSLKTNFIITDVEHCNGSLKLLVSGKEHVLHHKDKCMPYLLQKSLGKSSLVVALLY